MGLLGSLERNKQSRGRTGATGAEKGGRFTFARREHLLKRRGDLGIGEINYLVCGDEKIISGTSSSGELTRACTAATYIPPSGKQKLMKGKFT